VSGRVRAAWLAGCLLGSALGCKSPAPAPPASAPAEAPALAELVREHNERVGRFQELYVSGQAELRWRDEKGSHFEHCRVEIYWRPPFRTGVNLTKVGERFLWLGSDETRWWAFDLASSPTTLTLGAHGDDEALEGAPLGIQPLALLDLMGLGRWEANGAGTVAWSAEEAGWTFDVVGEGGPVRVVIDAQTRLPKRTAALDAAGEPALVGELEDYETVETEGMSPGASPKCPKRVALRRDASHGRITLFLEGPTGRSDLVKDGHFDLDRLQRLLKPERVVKSSEDAAEEAEPNDEGAPDATREPDS
jgi:hypothetical protein